MKIYRAYKTELDPNDKQRSVFWRHTGAARYIYNWGLQERIDAHDPDDALKWIDENMPTVVNGANIKNGPYTRNLSSITQSRELTVYKKRNPWLYDITARTTVSELRDLDSAFKNFFRRVKKGEVPGFPKFKKRGKHNSFHAEYQNIHIEPGRVRLSKIGWVRLKEHGYLPMNLHVNSVTISERAGRWYISVQVEEDIDKVTAKTGIVGIDVGVKDFAVLSDGMTYEHPNPLKAHLGKLRRIQKSMSRSRLKNGGYDKKGRALKGWKPTSNYKRMRECLSHVHDRIAKIRKDFLHQTTTEISKKYEVICVEGLNVEGMTSHKTGIGKRGRASNRAMLEQGWGEFIRQLGYKCEWYGSILLVVDKWFPSTKMCSQCGNIQDMPLTDRTYYCDNCGMVKGRDDNASQNLMTVATSLMDTLNACGDGSAGLSLGDTLETIVHGNTVKVKVYGAIGGTSTLKQEPGSLVRAMA